MIFAHPTNQWLAFGSNRCYIYTLKCFQGNFSVKQCQTDLSNSFFFLLTSLEKDYKGIFWHGDRVLGFTFDNLATFADEAVTGGGLLNIPHALGSITSINSESPS
jgi:hypothetical protein